MIIAACVLDMCDGVRFISINGEYPQDQHRNPLFFDLNEKGRWFNKVTRSVLFKRIAKAGRFVPAWKELMPGCEKSGWAYFRNFLHREPNDDPLSQSFESKMSFINAVATYTPPVGELMEQNAEFKEMQDCDGKGFWKEFESASDVVSYDGFFPLSPDWNKVLMEEVFREHPGWADEVWEKRVALSLRRDFEPGERPW